MGPLKRKNSGDIKNYEEISFKSMLALTVVILLFTVAILMMGYAYHVERSSRFE